MKLILSDKQRADIKYQAVRLFETRQNTHHAHMILKAVIEESEADKIFQDAHDTVYGVKAVVEE